MADEPKVDLKLLDQIIKKVLAYQPEKKPRAAKKNSGAACPPYKRRPQLKNGDATVSRRQSGRYVPSVYSTQRWKHKLPQAPKTPVHRRENGPSALGTVCYV